MIIETSAPSDGQSKIALIVAKHDGFVVTSESKENQGESLSNPATTVTIIARVPAAKFSEAIEEIKMIGGRIQHFKATGQDVTEEYIDLEARLRTKRALEMQFLEIMSRPGKSQTRSKCKMSWPVSAPKSKASKVVAASSKINPRSRPLPLHYILPRRSLLPRHVDFALI